jgi:hypothetical protein
MTARLQKCLAAGEVLALFPLLRDWPESELRALLDDVAAFHRQSLTALDSGYGGEALKAENFLSPVRSKALDDARDEVAMRLMITCSEIASVAMYYLGTPTPEAASD